MSGFPAALVAKVVVPVVLIAGGGVAFAASVRTTKPAGEFRAWIDNPLDGATVRVEPVDVVAHASGPSDVTRIELVVDDVVVGDFSTLTQTDRLATGSNRWAATVGTHTLLARARVGSVIVDSAVIGIVVTDDASLLTMPERGPRPTAPATTATPVATTDTVATTTTEVTTTTSSITTTASTEQSTTEPTEPTTTLPATSVPVPTFTTTRPTTTTSTVAPGEPPRIAGVGHTPNSIDTDTDVSVLARASNPSGHPITITISMKGPTGDWTTVKTCTASPCVHTARFNTGDWRYRATVVDDLGRSATSADTAQTRFTVDPIIK